MIVQGSNTPICIYFEDDIDSIKELSVSIFDKKKRELKHWSNEDVVYTENAVLCPLTQEETMEFPPGLVSIQFKWLDVDGDILFAHEYIDRVYEWFDKSILGGDVNA